MASSIVAIRLLLSVHESRSVRVLPGPPPGKTIAETYPRKSRMGRFLKG